MLRGSIASADIQDGTVSAVDLGPGAAGAKVIRYDLGSYDFTGGFSLVGQLPGTWDRSIVEGSTWSATLLKEYSPTYGVTFAIPGPGDELDTNYAVVVDSAGTVVIGGVGPGEFYHEVRLYRTMPTSTVP